MQLSKFPLRAKQKFALRDMLSIIISLFSHSFSVCPSNFHTILLFYLLFYFLSSMWEILLVCVCVCKLYSTPCLNVVVVCEFMCFYFFVSLSGMKMGPG